MRFINGCDQSAIDALRYLANNPRPKGGEDLYNSLHLVQIADELERSIKNAGKEMSVAHEFVPCDCSKNPTCPKCGGMGGQYHLKVVR